MFLKQRWDGAVFQFALIHTPAQRAAGRIVEKLDDLMLWSHPVLPEPCPLRFAPLVLPELAGRPLLRRLFR